MFAFFKGHVSISHRRVTFAAACALAALFGGFAQAAPQGKPLEITVGRFGGATTTLGYFIAKNKGYFKEENLIIHEETLKGPVDTRNAVANGLVGLANTGITTFTPTAEAGQPAKIVAGIITEQPIYWVVNPGFLKKKGFSADQYRTLPVKERIALLRDAKWGVSQPGSIWDQVAAYQARKFGIDWVKDLNINYFGGDFNAIYANFAQGTVDVVTSSGGNLDTLARTSKLPGSKALIYAFTYDEMSKEFPETLIPGEQWIANFKVVNKDALRAFLRAYQRGVDYVKDHNVDEITKLVLDENPDIVSEQAKIALKETLIFSKNNTAFDSKLTPKQIDIGINFALSQGQIKKSLTHDQVYTEEYLQ
jgi:ABC-type nitrate/sulfonate/bicarbonate transport system substrate-binding protein